MWKLILLPSDDCISWLYSSENLASHQSILFTIILAILVIFFVNKVLNIVRVYVLITFGVNGRWS